MYEKNLLKLQRHAAELLLLKTVGPAGDVALMSRQLIINNQ